LDDQTKATISTGPRDTTQPVSAETPELDNRDVTGGADPDQESDEDGDRAGVQEEIDTNTQEQGHDQRRRDADAEPRKLGPGRLTGRS
jgi:hypothetical protein